MTIMALSSLSAGVDPYRYYASRLHIVPSMNIRSAQSLKSLKKSVDSSGEVFIPIRKMN